MFNFPKHSFFYKLFYSITISLLLILTSCNNLHSDVSLTGSPKLITFRIDAADYNNISQKLSSKLLTDNKVLNNKGKVLALGPVDLSSTIYRIDPRTLQEKLQTTLHKSGNLQVTFAVDAMKDNSAAEARYKIMQLQWEKESLVDPKDLKTFGQLANIDYLLFGRVSSQQTVQGDKTEVTYTYNWKLGDCKTGLLVWTDEEEINKRGNTPSVPGWVLDRRNGEDDHYYYEIGHAKEQNTLEKARIAAMENAKELIANRNQHLLPMDETGLVHPIQGKELKVQMLPQGLYTNKTSKGFQAWIIVKHKKESYEKLLKERNKILSLSLEAEKLTREALQSSKQFQRRKYYNQAIAQLNSIKVTYPIANSNGVNTERLLFNLADLYKQVDGSCAAQDIYQSIIDRSSKSEWIDKSHAQLKQVNCGKKERAQFLLSKRFSGKKVSVLAAYRTNGKIHYWKKIDQLMIKYLNGLGSQISSASKKVGANKIIKISNANGKFNNSSDISLVVAAIGEMIQRSNKNNPNGKDFRFKGEIKTYTIDAGQLTFIDEYNGLSGWNPISESMVMEVVAIQAFNRWKKEYKRYLGTQDN
ncbi:MAG: hypothetical protein HQL46_00730 [Gammaproteobacteria bacterium]|nr:hypothetical protein [Gammaproteobacteria bacterium]